MTTSSALILVLWLASFSAWAGAEQPEARLPLTSDECLALGFESATLGCQTCETLSSVLGERGAAYRADCQRCCFQDESDATYGYALYTADRRYVAQVEGLKAVLNALRTKYGQDHIGVKHRNGQRPMLKLFKHKEDDEASVVEAVAEWGGQVLQDFLTAHLEGGGDEDGDKEVEVGVEG